ncbi:hypothetical protein HZC07_01370 [Candidatus Micrarchaeota archaeon]|nr:hypothetical protein [Candidatus Micrarchaeota archaeon]
MTIFSRGRRPDTEVQPPEHRTTLERTARRSRLERWQIEFQRGELTTTDITAAYGAQKRAIKTELDKVSAKKGGATHHAYRIVDSLKAPELIPDALEVLVESATNPHTSRKLRLEILHDIVLAVASHMKDQDSSPGALALFAAPCREIVETLNGFENALGLRENVIEVLRHAAKIADLPSLKADLNNKLKQLEIITPLAAVALVLAGLTKGLIDRVWADLALGIVQAGIYIVVGKLMADMIKIFVRKNELENEGEKLIEKISQVEERLN